MPDLIAIADMPPVSGVAVPFVLYTVLRRPALLAGMAYPSPRTPWSVLADQGLRHVVNLAAQGPSYDPAPLTIAHAVALEDLYGGLAPDDPEAEEHLVHEAAQTVVDLLRRREGVLVHCVGGTGRTGAVIGCTLRLLGVPTEAVLAYLDTLYQARGKDGWPESPWQAGVVERCHPYVQ
jgi:protein-tyrosine phosphatase